ncbi:MAG: serine/threonine protein kinase [Planctomycetales bacterium]|nr:serine/threonine protein kinase [Planctomycetales bacterium]
MNDPHSNDSSIGRQPDDDIWDQIAEKVNVLVARWDAREAGTDTPQIADLLDDVADDCREMVACELIKIDLEYRSDQQQDCSQRLPCYFEQLGIFADGKSVPADLIYEEVQIRLQSGEQVDVQSVLDEFPHQAVELKQLLGSSSQNMHDSSRAETIDHESNPIAANETSRVGDTSLRTASFQALREGDQIDDFDLLLLLGSGSFARVFLARQRSLERLVALKISKDVGTEPRTLAQLDHPNIVRVFDVRSCRKPLARLLYMELVAGGTLQDVVHELQDCVPAERTGKQLLDVVDGHLAAAGTAPPEGSEIRHAIANADWCRTVCLIGLRLASGLAYAHEKGVLHRDIKPANVLLTPEASPKLADFNISFTGGRADENPEDTFGGSMGYMSPEQLEACHPLLGGAPAKVRHASDIYSVGVLLWELMLGRRPFDDNSHESTGWALSVQRMIDERRTTDIEVKIGEQPERISAPLAQVFAKCLAADPASRFQSAKQLAFALMLCLHPRCWKLLQPPATRWLRLPLRFPVWAILLATLVPSVLAAVFNLTYNSNFIELFLPESGRTTLHQVQQVVNAIAFPVGIAIVVWFARRTAKLMTKEPSDEAADRLLLRLGQIMAAIAVALWVIAGFTYPIAFEILLVEDVTFRVYTLFVLSLALCGALAGTYPFFLVTMICVRWILPEMIRTERTLGPRLADIQSLRKTNRLFVGLTAVVPFLGILLTVLTSKNLQADAKDFMTGPFMIISSLTGIIGFGVMYWIHREIDEDLTALELLDEAGSGSQNT